MFFGQPDIQNFERGTEKEWLVTNGLGGFASGTVIGANTRKYHGLLFAALKPPGERTLLLAKLEEEVIYDGESFNLGVNQTGTGLYPNGYRYLREFKIDPFPIYTYGFKDVIIEKTIFMVHKENATVVRYKILTGESKNIRIKVTPFVNCRHYHHTVRKNDWPFKQEAENNGVIIKARDDAPELYLRSDLAQYNKGEGYWFEGIFYKGEEERGLEPWEDHFMPGHFEIANKGSFTFAIVASTKPVPLFNSYLMQIQEEKRLAQLIEKAGYKEEFIGRLVLAADSFIVDRVSTGKKTVIAGYPWFTDWGRDTMIALPGLTLVTKRFDEAQEILHTFAKYCKDGLVPNTFPDEGGEPLYNTVDASLWFFHAVYKYIEYTKDFSFIRQEIYPVLEEIINYYVKGTHFNIKLDEDGLIRAGTRGVQLTWMDAKVGDWVVTPREGKPVEINALWYNALMVMAFLAKEFGYDPDNFLAMAGRTRDSFIHEFWNKEKQCLYDVIGDTKDDAVRPNQIFAVSLPFTMLDHSREKKIVYRVWQDLYTPFGLRSLSPDDINYIGIYSGDQVKRDGAYHQGTAWSWLTGPFITSYRKIYDYSLESREVARKLMAPWLVHLRDHGVGYISEIFDGDSPNNPRGCYAQAWGVAEVLRAYVEDVVEIRPKLKK